MSSRAFTLALLAALVSCSSETRPAVHRIAILPADVLTDTAPPGAGRVFAILTGSHLQGLTEVTPLVVDSHADAVAQRATLELASTIDQNGSELEVTVHERDASGGTRRIFTESGEGIATLAERVARRFSSEARASAACGPEAVTAMSEAMSAQGPQMIEPMTRAVKASPSCGEAWLMLGNALASVGQGRQAVMAWQSGTSPQARVDEITRARLRAQAAAAAQSPDWAEAILALAKLLPADAEWQARAGNVEMTRRRFAESAQFYQRALKADPGAGPVWNDYSYLQALQGDWDGALQSADEYARLAPASPNPFDSRGEILFLARRYTEAAEAFETAYAQDASFLEGHTLRKAAEAYWLAGDAASGRRAIEMWVEDMPADSRRRELTLAQWEHRTGDRDAAMARLAAIGGEAPEARAQLVVWLTEAGQRARATELAGRVSGRLGLLLQFVAQPSAEDSVWRARARQAFPGPAQQVFGRLALTYAFALDRKWASAAAILREDYPQMSPLRSGQLLAVYRRALLASGQEGQTGDLPDRPFLPTVGTDSYFDCLAYGE